VPQKIYSPAFGGVKVKRQGKSLPRWW